VTDATTTPEGSPRSFAFQAKLLDGVDTGRDVCRMHPEALQLLGVRAWEPVELKGKGRAAALAGHLDWGAPRNLCVIDSLIAQNVGVADGERIVVTPVRPTPARAVWLEPLGTSAVPAELLRVALLGKAVVAGERETLLPQDYTRAFSQQSADGLKQLRDAMGPQWQTMRVTVIATDPEAVVTIVPSTRLHWSGDVAVPVPGRAGRVAADSTLRLGDLGGLDTQIAELRELMELKFRHTELLGELGVSGPQGVMLQGPVGCGKSSMTYALAADLGVSMSRLSGLEQSHQDARTQLAAISAAFADGQGDRVVLVEDVERLAPIEVDTAGPATTALLQALDRAGASPDIFVVATTAVPEQCDPALFAEGRLDRRIDVPLPSREVRRRILDIHTRSHPLAPDVDLDSIAQKTPGFVGADLERLCRQAGIEAAARLRNQPGEGLVAQVCAADFDAARSHVRPSSLGSARLEVGDTTWADVGDAVETKKALDEAVLWPVRYPDTFSRLGMAPPGGVLLYGPPGCGKTYLVRALAGEAEANLLSVKGAELLSKWVGESEAGIRELFRRARGAAPAIVFLDEIDALAPARGGSMDSGVTDRVVAQLLTELDGIEPLRGVAVIGATNRPDLIDPALLRPGRLERHVFVEPPDADARREILVATCRRMPLAEGIDLGGIAAGAEGFSAADLAALAREAGYSALHRDPQAARITAEDFAAARARIRASVDAAVVDQLRRFSS